MHTAEASSDVDFPLEPILLGDATTSVWLDGDVLACACPQCGAPMSIRLWLMVADCFCCGASVELTAQQEAEALRLLRQREPAPPPEAPDSQPPSEAPDSQKRREPVTRPMAAVPVRIDQPRQPEPQNTRQMAQSPRPVNAPSARPNNQQPARSAGKGADPRARQPEAETSKPEPSRAMPAVAAVADAQSAALAPQPGSGAWSHPVAPEASVVLPQDATVAPPVGGRSSVEQWDERAGMLGMFDALPAWLISAVFHLVLMLLLSLWMIEPPDEEIEITLATTVDALDEPGNQSKDDAPEPRDFEDPGAVETITVLEVPGASPEDSIVPPVVEVPVDAGIVLGDAPELAVHNMDPTVPVRAGRMFAGRDPDAKAHLLLKWGGTSETEAAVARGLEWLSRRQNSDGSWSLHAFHKAPGAGGKGEGMGSLRSDSAGTGLALLPMLGAGNDHVRDGPYRRTVSDGLKWLIDHQREKGDLRGPDHGDMYAHALAAIALCEAYAITGDEQLRDPSQRAIDFIVAAQHSAGGWRYRPGEPGDTSVLGWQWMALQSAKMAHLNVPSSTLAAAAGYLDRAQSDSVGARYGYQPGRSPTHTMTAEALLCRQYQGWPRGHQGLREGAGYLLNEHLPAAERPNIYYWYYATQMMHHLGGRRWQRWNLRMRQTLLEMQERNGHEAGSWTPRGQFASRGGRIYMTALALCTLEVYYRHMPLYHNVQLTGPADEE